MALAVAALEWTGHCLQRVCTFFACLTGACKNRLMMSCPAHYMRCKLSCQSNVARIMPNLIHLARCVGIHLPRACAHEQHLHARCQCRALFCCPQQMALNWARWQAPHGRFLQQHLTIGVHTRVSLTHSKLRHHSCLYVGGCLRSLPCCGACHLFSLEGHHLCTTVV